MSWSLSVPPTPASAFAAAIDAAQLPADTYNDPEIVQQWKKQIEAAKAAAHAIFNHGYAFGDEQGDLYRAAMSGHAAHGGLAERTDYTPSEFVQVTISRDPPATK